MTSSLAERLARQPPGYPFPIRRILAIYAGLMVVVLLASLDQTIVATALPRVVADLGGLSSYSWVFTAYLLCATVTVPVYGKLGDIHGRRPLILAAIVIFLTGSALCGIATNMTELVVFRGIQGLGAGGLIPLALAIVGRLVPPRDRGRYQGLISAVFGASSIIGPAIGGLIVDNTSWRWIFYVNLPIGGIALVVIASTMPKIAQRREHSVDYAGALLLAAGTAALLLGLVWGGEQYAWTSPQVIGTLVGAVLLLAAFGLVERRVRETILPFDLLRTRTIAASAACMFLAATCMFGTIAFVPLFVQGVIGTSATSSGVVLTPLMLGAVVTSVISGQWVSRTGRYRLNALLGPVFLGAGMLLLWRLGTDATSGEAVRDMVVAGIGMGLMMQVFVLSAQNVVPPDRIGTVTALLQFGRSIGTTIGVTVFGVIVNQGLPEKLRGTTQLAHRLPAAERSMLASALHPAFLVAAGACVLLFAIAWLGIEQRPLRAGWDEPGGGPAAGAGAAAGGGAAAGAGADAAAAVGAVPEVGEGAEPGTGRGPATPTPRS